jgi:hypothetical protein
MVPIHGRIRSDVGLLGSPAFEIPRTVERDRAFDDLKEGDEHRRLLRTKNRHNALTAVLFLLAQFVNLYVVAMLGMVALDHYFEHGFWVVPAATVAGLVFSIGFQILLERAVTSSGRMSPRFCSISDPYFWWHERFWKMSVGGYLGLFNGTPMKNVIWRLLGVRIGRRVFDDGCAMPEKILVHIGDDVALNAGSTVQAHSLEDGAFKSDHIVIGPGVTIGPRAFVHYGVTLHEGAMIDADAFLMKGQEVPAFTRWRGNPAGETRDPHVTPPPPPRSAVLATFALAVLIAAAISTGVMLALPPPQPATRGPAVTAVIPGAVSESRDEGTHTGTEADAGTAADPVVDTKADEQAGEETPPGGSAAEADETAGTAREADDGHAVTTAARSVSWPGRRGARH